MFVIKMPRLQSACVLLAVAGLLDRTVDHTVFAQTLRTIAPGRRASASTADLVNDPVGLGHLLVSKTARSANVACAYRHAFTHVHVCFASCTPICTDTAVSDASSREKIFLQETVAMSRCRLCRQNWATPLS